MNRIVQGTFSILLGFVMLAWFVYSMMNPPTRPSETYSMDWMLIFLTLVGSLAAFVGGVITYVRK